MLRGQSELKVVQVSLPSFERYAREVISCLLVDDLAKVLLQAANRRAHCSRHQNFQGSASCHAIMTFPSEDVQRRRGVNHLAGKANDC